MFEPVLPFDKEPIATRLSFAYNARKEDKLMNKIDFVIFCIQHHEDFPVVKEIDLKTAQAIIDGLDPDADVPEMTAQEFMKHWNIFVHDPKVMNE